MKKDIVFAKRQNPVEAFEFNDEVTSVFDDMLRRSVPFYMESITRQAQICIQFYKKKTVIYDLGCSNGNLGIMICKSFGKKKFSMIGIDSSCPMIKRYNNRLKGKAYRNNVRLICNPAENIEIINASVVILNLTMQFIDPYERNSVIQNIYNGLVSGGILLLTEKIIHRTKTISDIQQKYYTKFKKENGYSDLEISQKRDALEDILIPETLETHQNRLQRAGFSSFDVWLKWFNFASLIAIK